MLPELGHFALMLALLLAALTAFFGIAGPATGRERWVAAVMPAVAGQFVMLATAMGVLGYAFVTYDFSVLYVAENSNSALPLLYRVAAIWGAHEGSLLLWIFLLSAWMLAVAIGSGRLPRRFAARVLGVLGLVSVGFLLFILFTSDPFRRLIPAAADGRDLNPLLQDPGLAAHPPVLYTGYVGLAVAFGFACAAMLEGRLDQEWARWTRPWTTAAWVFLTCGITLGSWWSYYTLGWGGYWAWDPVENASFMPWLLATALLHSSLVLERRGALISWTILLAILAFSLSMVGTFLVRSGVLTSVHAFAVDSQRGVYILGVIGLMTGSALTLFAWRASTLRTGALFMVVSRESGMILNNLFLLVATAVVFLGTFYPVFLDAMNLEKVSIGPPWFKIVFTPIAVPLLMLVVIGPLLNWRRDELSALWRRVRWPVGLTAAALAIATLFVGIGHMFTACGVALGVWLISGALMVLARRWRLGQASPAEVRRLVRSTPLAVVGLVLAHAGLGVLTLGVTGMTSWQSNKVLTMIPGQSVNLAGKTITLDTIQAAPGPNYDATEAQFNVRSRFGDRTLISERRVFPVSQTHTTVAAIGLGLFGNTYISIGDPNPDGSLVVRLWDHPLVDWIWGGGLIMALGGAVSLADRGLRVGAANKVARPAAAAQPASA